MCRFAKCFVSFVLASLLSFVSLVPCFANVTPDDMVSDATDAVCSVGIGQYSGFLTSDFIVPIHSYCIMTVADNLVTGNHIAPWFQTSSQFLFENDKTLYWNIYPIIGSDLYTDTNAVRENISNLSSYLPEFRIGIGYTDSSVSSMATQLQVTRVAQGNLNFQQTYSNTYRVTIPSKAPNGEYYNNFDCYYPMDIEQTFWTAGHSGALSFVVDMFQFVDTADSQLLTIVDQILAEAQEANLNLSNVLTACNNIIVQLESMGADIEVIREMMATLVSLSNTQINILGNIDTNVSAIYYFLTQELKSESDGLSGEAAEIGSGIDNNHAAEQYYQTSMQSSYDSLNLDNFSFGGITGALELVGTVFSDIWSAWGEYNILFTYPLILGISLLVIGRLSKHGGGNSSRNSEHKGGEGGA